METGTVRHDHLQSRAGVTLIELLVAIAILTILMALLLPAVQYCREAGRRATCRNHLRQVALATHNHESLHGHLPTGGWGWRWHGEPDRGFGAAQPGGWVYNILPFLEQTQLREAGSGARGPARAQALADAAAMPVRLFVCPSRRSSGPFPFVHSVDYHNMARPQAVARSDYAACSGDQEPDISHRRGRGPRSLAEGDSPSYVWRETDRTGVVFRRSLVGFADVTDGLTNTYLVGEKYVARGDYSTGQAQNDDQHLLVGYDSDTLRTTDLNFPPLPDGFGEASDHSFGSAHPLAFHAAMADGSVFSIAFEVDPQVHRTRGNRGDGVAAPAP
jgi:prepilin-type N-terminal cleavage/methylation domain-containing protein